MNPMGQRPITFPGKTKEWLGKRVLMWWERHRPNKKKDRQSAKRTIAQETKK